MQIMTLLIILSSEFQLKFLLLDFFFFLKKDYHMFWATPLFTMWLKKNLNFSSSCLHPPSERPSECFYALFAFAFLMNTLYPAVSECSFQSILPVDFFTGSFHNIHHSLMNCSCCLPGFMLCHDVNIFRTEKVCEMHSKPGCINSIQGWCYLKMLFRHGYSYLPSS